MIDLTKEQREELYRDICSVYNYTKNKNKLKKMSNSQLFAFRENLRQQGKIERFLSGRYSVHIDMFMKKYESNHYLIDVKNKATVIALGLKTGIKNNFGQEVIYQMGYIVINNSNKIIQVQMHGDQLTRFNGLELIL